MFGISFFEITLVLIVALIAVGPTRLPTMLRTLGRWVGTARRLTAQIRVQTGIDDLLREEGITGGIDELRNVLRGDLSRVNHYRGRASAHPIADPYLDSMAFDPTREYPIEGADAMGALPDDLAEATGSVNTDAEFRRVSSDRSS